MFGQNRETHSQRVYVRVVADHQADGSVLPRMLYWCNDDGVEVPYVIDITSPGRPAHSRKAGGQGLLYNIVIRGKRRELYYDDFEGRFFVVQESATGK